MLNLMNHQGGPSFNRLLFFLLIIAILFLAGGCGTMDFQIGRSFDSSQLESVLIPGVSNGAQVEALLGEPYGRGRALMPFHEEPRNVWTYYFEQGSIDPGGKENKDKRKYLFVFLAEDTFEGYMWFDSQLQ